MDPSCLPAGDDTDVSMATTSADTSTSDGHTTTSSPASSPGTRGTSTTTASSWTAAVQQAFAAHPDLMLLVLHDASDPGFPSFPVLRADRHLAMMGGRLLPECFLQGGVSQGELT